MNRFLTAIVMETACLAFSGCGATAPVQPTVAPQPATVMASLVPERVSVTAPSTDSVSTPFGAVLGKVFPVNKVGASLAFASGVSMPKLSVTDLGDGYMQVYVRVHNYTDADTVLNFRCVAGEGAAAERYIRSGITFPRGTYRDYSFRMKDVPGVRLLITVAP